MARIRSFTNIGLLIVALESYLPAQTTIECERVDQDDQVTANLSVTTGAGSASSNPGTGWDFESLFWLQDEKHVGWSGVSSAAVGSNDATALFQITADNPTGWGQTATVPQVTMAFGGILDASADASDPSGSAGATWRINPETAWLDIPSVAQGTYKVLGDQQSGTLYGTMDIIITFNGSGSWNFFDEDDTDEWQITCGSSNLVGNRPEENDGWVVSGTLSNDGSQTQYLSFWPDNVNQIVFVDEPVSTGGTKLLRIRIPSIDIGCSALHTGPTNSTLNSGFSFSSSFEVEAN